MKFNPNKDRVIFTHIPKCAGTSLHLLLKEAIKSEVDYDYSDADLKGIGLRKGALAAMYRLCLNKSRLFDYNIVGNTVVGSNYIHLDGTVDFKALNRELVLGSGGHQRFKENPFDSDEKRIYRLTVLRNPLDRIYSFYRFVSQNKDHPITKHMLKSGFKLEEITLDNFISFLMERNYPSKYKFYEQISNTQTLFLCGKESEINAEVAYNHITQYYDFYSTIDTLPMLVHDLESFFDKPLTMKHVNKTVSDVDVEPSTLKKLIDINQEDIRLYSKVLSRKYLN